MKNALGLQNTPPNLVLVGIALFLTLIIMTPTLNQINEQAYIPYQNDEITQFEAIDRAQVPMKEFMLRQTRLDALQMFVGYTGETMPPSQSEYVNLPMTVIIPAYMVSELSRAFLMGFLVYLPFLVLDIVVASTLMSMGMMMLPPSMISMPFKILLFIVVNGWSLMFSTLIESFN